MNNDELLILSTYVCNSDYRLRVMNTLSNVNVSTPSKIAEKSNIRVAHISKVLHELKEKELCVCINEEMRKGRLYRLTEKGRDVIKFMVDNSN